MGVAYLIGQRHHDAETDIDDDYFEVNQGTQGGVMRIDGVLTSMGVRLPEPWRAMKGPTALACCRTGGRQCARLLRKP